MSKELLIVYWRIIFWFFCKYCYNSKMDMGIL